jgi:hypothetical protein
MNEINLYHLPYIESPAKLAAKVEEAMEAQIKSLDLCTPMKDQMNEIEEAVLETVSEKYLMLKASDTGLPIGILHCNSKGAAIISPLTQASVQSYCQTLQLFSSMTLLTPIEYSKCN